MRFVCLNLDMDDASLLRRTLARSLGSHGDSCGADSEALSAMIGELDRLLAGAPRSRFLTEPVPAAAVPRLRIVRGEPNQ